MYDCKAPLSRFYYPDTRRIINAFIFIIIIIIIINSTSADRSRDSNASSLPIKVLDRHSLCHGLLLLVLRSAKV